MSAGDPIRGLFLLNMSASASIMVTPLEANLSPSPLGFPDAAETCVKNQNRGKKMKQTEHPMNHKTDTGRSFQNRGTAIKLSQHAERNYQPRDPNTKTKPPML